ncbi:MAG: Gfo/Idh/MocA family oxidoreductase [Alistipes sp.]|nr:Gfo/Idh/MocA family oxidoreductase [Alistipes sp.]MBR3886174.1 Gfo/Idh/MocA family oxidoreductase [Alistipes sp.]
MKKFNLFTLLCAILMMGAMQSCDSGATTIAGDNYSFQDGMIVFDEPARAEGQQSMLAFAAEPIPVVRVGFIGLGMRGPGAVTRFTHLEGVEIKGLCDLEQSNVDKCQDILAKASLPKADGYVGPEAYKELCERDDIDLIYIATDWVNHTPIAVYAMEHGKHVAIEVPAATSIAECWQLVDTSERTRRHCMMLENCVYDFFELTSLNMTQQGLFGEILHAEGAYIHNLSDYWNDYYGNWRLDFNQKHRGDVYATHGFGPVCQALNIHRGNRLNYLVCMDTKSVNGLEWAQKKMGSTEFANGDHTNTLIKTELGQTIELQHNVYTPRPYNRLYQLTGTKGFANKYPITGFTFMPGQVPDEVLPEGATINPHGFVSDEVKEAVLAAYKHPIHQEIEEKAKTVGGHGGMDFVMDYRLIYCLHNGLPLDQDVYDAAEWSCIGELSATSAKHNSMPVAVPDFTRGDWNKLQGVKFHTK